ncbi:MAG: hypothetical protein LUD77_10600 [Clostridiales bacterium]|nr:hypothetical protein [Clostridiales bacterium]
MPVTVNAETNLSETLGLYADTLTEYIKVSEEINAWKIGETSEYKFALAYIDGDDVPDLLVSTYSDRGWGKLYYYFASDSELKSGYTEIRLFDNIIKFVPNENIIYYAANSLGKSKETFYQWTGDSIEPTSEYVWVYGFVTPKNDFFINNEQVDEDYYNAQLNSIKNSYIWVSYSTDYAFEITAENISDMTVNPQNYIIG